MSARDVIAKAAWDAHRRCESYDQYAVRILTALTSAGFRILSPDEVDAVTVEKCAEAGKAAIEDEAVDLEGIRDSYIEARTTGIHAGRRIPPDMAKTFASQFHQRADAVDKVADVVAAAIRALAEEKRP